ncbi:MAG TPA: ribosome maturation factor RimM [Usitatibacter sp.]|nr:ribosome maturation factor RimM [Usitatibacter sp.]
MGRIVGAFGIHGWAKVKAFTEAPGGLGEYETWVVRTPEGWRAMALDGFEVHSKGPVAKLAGCGDPEAADALRGADVAVPREALGDAEEGSLYWVDLVGLDVVNANGESLGKVAELFEAGDTSVLVLQGRKGPAIMIPFVADYVKSVDREAKRIAVDWKVEDAG